MSFFTEFRDATVTLATGGLNAPLYQAPRDAAKAQQRAADEQRVAMAKQEKLADEAFNRANQKKPNIAAFLMGNRAAGLYGMAGTTLTSPAGIDPAQLTLGRASLLGA